MTDENVNTGFDEHNDNPLESHGFEKVARKGNFPTMLDLIAMLLIIVLSQAVVSVVGVALGLPMPDMLSGDVVDIEQFIGEQVVRGQSFAVIYPLSMILAFALLYIYINFRDGRGKVARASVRGFNPNVILGGLIWLIAVQVVVEPLSLLLPAEDQASGQGFWAIVTAVIFAPVFEELIFRGLLLESLLRRHRRLLSVVVSSLIFAIVHFQPSVMLVAFVSGLVFGTLYLHTNSIFTTIILHSINNSIAYSLITLDLDHYSYYKILGGGSLYYSVYAVCFVICAVAAIETWRRRKPKILSV